VGSRFGEPDVLVEVPLSEYSNRLALPVR
jgi:hypothetical protein